MVAVTGVDPAPVDGTEDVDVLLLAVAVLDVVPVLPPADVWAGLFTMTMAGCGAIRGPID